MSIESYIMIGDKRVPLHVKYSPILTDPPVTLNFHRSLTELRNTTFQASGSLTLVDLEMLGQLMWDHEPPYYPVKNDMSDIHVSIDTSGLERGLRTIRRIRDSLSHLKALAHRYRRSKLRQRRKHRAMFRRKKRGLA